MKKYVVGILIGILLTITVGVSATILYQANEIGFTPADNNWNVNNLESALNDLYTRSGNTSGSELTLYEDLSENNGSNIRRRTTITKTFEAEANTEYYILGVYSWSVAGPGVNYSFLHMGDDYGSIESFSEGVTVLTNPYSIPFVKIRTSSAGTVTININASVATSSYADVLTLHIYK